jgi:putative aldouronate transport system permease protein
MSCFRDISDDLEASAKIDGAGYFTIFIRIYLPLSIPVLATMALFEGVRQWNSWFDTLYFTNSDWLMTLSGHLIQIIKKSSAVSMQDVMKDMEKMEMNPQGIRLATMVAAVTPIIFIYPFLQRYFVKGLRIGSIKG